MRIVTYTHVFSVYWYILIKYHCSCPGHTTKKKTIDDQSVVFFVFRLAQDLHKSREGGGKRMPYEGQYCPPGYLQQWLNNTRSNLLITSLISPIHRFISTIVNVTEDVWAIVDLIPLNISSKVL